MDWLHTKAPATDWEPGFYDTFSSYASSILHGVLWTNDGRSWHVALQLGSSLQRWEEGSGVVFDVQQDAVAPSVSVAVLLEALGPPPDEDVVLLRAAERLLEVERLVAAPGVQDVALSMRAVAG